MQGVMYSYWYFVFCVAYSWWLLVSTNKTLSDLISLGSILKIWIRRRRLNSLEVSKLWEFQEAAWCMAARVRVWINGWMNLFVVNLRVYDFFQGLCANIKGTMLLSWRPSGMWTWSDYGPLLTQLHILSRTLASFPLPSPCCFSLFNTR